MSSKPSSTEKQVPAMVNIVARALCLAGSDGHVSLDECGPESRQWHMDCARAAIDAMLNPTFAMEGAGTHAVGKHVDHLPLDCHYCIQTIWQAMIDEALR